MKEDTLCLDRSPKFPRFKSTATTAMHATIAMNAQLMYQEGERHTISDEVVALLLHLTVREELGDAAESDAGVDDVHHHCGQERQRETQKSKQRQRRVCLGCCQLIPSTCTTMHRAST